MRANRLIDLIALLRRHERITAADLASRLGVSRRTILRDLDALSASGVPVYAEHGRSGGFSILPGYRPETAGLTEAETEALFLPGGETAALALGRGAEFHSARRKLEAVLSDDAARGVGDLSGWLLVVPEGWGEPLQPPKAVRALAAAVSRKAVVELTYHAVERPVTVRIVHPLGLVLAGRLWYLLALREDSGEQRTYRVDRVKAVKPVGRYFESRQTVAQAWQNARESYSERDGLQVRVIARADSVRVVSYVASLAGRVVGSTALPDGRVEITTLAYGLDSATAMFTGIGDRAQVLSPPELVQALLDTSINNLERYAALN